MALKITSEIVTLDGLTSEAYLNIEKLSFKKNTGVDIWVNLYLNEATREQSYRSKTESNQIPKRFGVANNGSPGELVLLDSETIYQFGYSHIKSYLEDKGLTVEDVI